MEIRKITEYDNLNDISRIYYLSWKAAYNDILPKQYLDNLSESQWSAILLNPPWENSETFVMVENGKFVGTSLICAARDEEMKGWGEIVSIYLLPDLFDKGFGKNLLKHSIFALKSKGYKKIYLWTLKDNLRAQKFYSKNGFVFSGIEKSIKIANADLIEIQYIYE